MDLRVSHHNGFDTMLPTLSRSEHVKGDEPTSCEDWRSFACERCVAL